MLKKFVQSARGVDLSYGISLRCGGADSRTAAKVESNKSLPCHPAPSPTLSSSTTPTQHPDNPITTTDPYPDNPTTNNTLNPDNPINNNNTKPHCTVPQPQKNPSSKPHNSTAQPHNNSTSQPRKPAPQPPNPSAQNHITPVHQPHKNPVTQPPHNPAPKSRKSASSLILDNLLPTETPHTSGTTPLPSETIPTTPVTTTTATTSVPPDTLAPSLAMKSQLSHAQAQVGTSNFMAWSKGRWW
ncbi:hypothetical protein Pmani_034423 [Petrolisthes manimaculis]|uniref:Uncharacterized protein n=1 Tax=Petrolisthes manimaculis TaxID=1843537 RepID=A0AAE1TRM0_9EUCA|nr:hypothetical protein Pmani_034423 [Petrolisthes manimaculis]